jgi:hypothetical protein
VRAGTGALGRRQTRRQEAGPERGCRPTRRPGVREGGGRVRAPAGPAAEVGGRRRRAATWTLARGRRRAARSLGRAAGLRGGRRPAERPQVSEGLAVVARGATGRPGAARPDWPARRGGAVRDGWCSARSGGPEAGLECDAAGRAETRESSGPRWNWRLPAPSSTGPPTPQGRRRGWGDLLSGASPAASASPNPPAIPPESPHTIATPLPPAIPETPPSIFLNLSPPAADSRCTPGSRPGLESEVVGHVHQG